MSPSAPAADSPPDREQQRAGGCRPRTFVGTTTFHVDGMTGERCKLAVTQEISQLDGVGLVTVDVATGALTVSADKPIDRADLAAALAAPRHQRNRKESSCT